MGIVEIVYFSRIRIFLGGRADREFLVFGSRFVYFLSCLLLLGILVFSDL